MNNTFSRLVNFLACARVFSVNIAISFCNMEMHKVEKSKSSTSMRDAWYRKCSMSDVKQCINRWFCVFCENTTLHGFKYMSTTRSTIFEAAVWFVFCVSSMIFCGILMLRVWNSFSHHPIATSIDTSTRITQMSFPSVTICNNNKVYSPKAEVLAELLYKKGFTEEKTEQFFRSLPKLIRFGKMSIDNEIANSILDTLNKSVETLMEELMQPCSKLLVKCAWIGVVFDCNKIFKTVKSTEGFCCAFNFHYNQSFENNSMNNININIVNFFDLDPPGVKMNLNASGSGLNSGLTVALNVERDTYKGTTRPYVGASVMVHGPVDFPAGATHMALPGHSLDISVTCTSITAKNTLRDVPIDKRLCYLEEEARTKISNEIRYNYESCLLICESKQFVKFCNCSPFNYPEIQGKRKCYLPDVECLTDLENLKASLSVVSIARKQLWIEAFSDMGTFENMTLCLECLPECTDRWFRTTAENVKVENVTWFDNDFMDDLDIENISFVQVYFDDVFYIQYYKESTISWDVLLASFGGIFGLCLGGSVLSVIEVIYFLIREFFKRSRKKREQFPKSLPPEILPVPDKKIQTKQLQNQEEFNVEVCRYQPSFHQRRTTTPFKDKF